MPTEDWLQQATNQLEEAGIGTARLDALILSEDVTGKDRGWLLAHPEFELTKLQTEKLREIIIRRASHEPLAQIRGKTEFYGREFIIDKNVLEPRPESETMIELLKKLGAHQPTVIDVGTGSGALAITAKLEVADAKVLATDIDKKCLEIAVKNAQRSEADIEFYDGNLLAPIHNTTLAGSIVLANLPYVPDNFTINPAAMNEPKIAIFGGLDGLDIYRRMFEQIDSLKSEPRFILTESLPPQHKKLAGVAKKSGYELAKTDDFIQLFKRG